MFRMYNQLIFQTGVGIDDRLGQKLQQIVLVIKTHG